MRILFALLLLANTALAVNSTTMGTLTLTSTLNCISVKLSFTGADDNANNSAIIEYKQSSSGTWLAAYPPIVDRRATIGGLDNSAYQNQVRGSIVNLTPNTSYDVRVTVTDADGVTGVNPATGTVSTLTATPPTGGVTKYVSPSGNNSNDGSSATPWATIAFAIGATSPGDTIALKNGSYAGLTISTSGNAGAYRKLTSDAGAVATINATASNSLTMSANYWILDGLTFAACPESAVLISASQHHIYVQNCTAPNIGTANLFGCAFVDLAGSNNNILILSNTAGRTASGTGVENDAVWLNSTGINTLVVKGNTFNGNFWDGIGNGVNSYIDSMENTDFAENTFTGYQDDSMETDGGSPNMRVWGNVGSSGPTTGQSCLSQSAITGPCYVWRNTLKNSNPSASGVKGGHIGQGYVRFFHNVIRTTGNGGNEGLGEAGGPPLSENGIFRNNIFMVTGNAFDNQGRSNSYNYDDLFPTGGQTLINNWNSTTNYTTLAAFRSATGQELNGVNADPVFVNNLTDFHLQTTSPCKNTGVVLVNFNDATSSVPFQGTAPDMGAFEFAEATPTAPTLSSASINAAGTQLSLVFSATVQAGAGGNGGWTISPSGGAAGLTFSTGVGSNTLIYNITGRAIGFGETVTVLYTQPGNGIEATAAPQIDLLSITTPQSVSNGSVQGQVVATPVITLPAGTYTTAQTTTITDATPSAVIHYTTNGTAPTGASPVYSVPIPIPSTMTIKAMATKAGGFTDSAVATSVFTLNLVTNPASARYIGLRGVPASGGAVP